MQLHHVTVSGLLSNKKLNVMFVKLLINSFFRVDASKCTLEVQELQKEWVTNS